MTLAHRRANLAILLVCAAYALYSVGDAVLKYIGTDLPVGSIMTVAGGIMCLLSLPPLMIKGHIPMLWQSPKRNYHLARAATVGALAYLAANALRTVPLPDFYGILFMSPFLVGLLAHFLLHEEIGLHRIIATITGFIGVIILAGPHFTDMHAGYIFVFIQLFGVALHILIVRQLGTENPWPLLTFFPGFGIFVVGLIQFIGEPVWPDLSWMPVLTLYAVSIFVGQVLFSKAYTTTPLLAIIAPYLYTQMLWGLLFGIFLFNQLPTNATTIGAVIVIASGLGNLLYERHLRRRLLGGVAQAGAS